MSWKTEWRQKARQSTPRKNSGKSATRKRKRRDHIPADATHQFVVQKAYCVPAKSIIMDALTPYQIPVCGYDEVVKTVRMRTAIKAALIRDPEFFTMPMAQEATFSVPARRAEWAEFLLESTGRLVITGGRVNAKNEEWGRRRNGRMPTPWRQGDEPWVEADCKHGQQCLARLYKQRRR